MSADTWFGAVKSTVAHAKQVYMTVLQIMTGPRPFSSNFIEKALESAPGDKWIELDSIH